MDIGFIGLGIMGRPLALHLAQAGHTLHLRARGSEFLDAPVSGGEPGAINASLTIMVGRFACSRIIENHSQRILDHNFMPDFKALMHQKDLCVVMEEAHRPGLMLPSGCSDRATLQRDRRQRHGRGRFDRRAQTSGNLIDAAMIRVGFAGIGAGAARDCSSY